MWPHRTMLFHFKPSLKCSYMYTVYLTHSHPSLPLSSSLIAPTNLPLPVMSSCLYNPLDSTSVAHMHVSVEGIYEGRSWLPAPQPQDWLSFPWQPWTTSKSSARGGTRSLPSFHTGSLTGLILWRHLCNCGDVLSRGQHFTTLLPSWLWSTPSSALFPEPWGHWAPACTADHSVTYSQHFQHLWVCICINQYLIQ